MNPAALAARKSPQIFNLSANISRATGNPASYPQIALMDFIVSPVPLVLRAVFLSSVFVNEASSIRGFFIVVGLNPPFLTVSNSFKCLLGHVAYVPQVRRSTAMPLDEYPIAIPPGSPISLYACGQNGARLFSLASLQLTAAA